MAIRTVSILKALEDKPLNSWRDLETTSLTSYVIRWNPYGDRFPAPIEVISDAREIDDPASVLGRLDLSLKEGLVFKSVNPDIHVDFQLGGRVRSNNSRLENSQTSVNLRSGDAFVVKGVWFSIMDDDTKSPPASIARTDPKISPASPLSEKPPRLRLRLGSKVTSRSPSLPDDTPVRGPKSIRASLHRVESPLQLAPENSHRNNKSPADYISPYPLTQGTRKSSSDAESRDRIIDGMNSPTASLTGEVAVRTIVKVEQSDNDEDQHVDTSNQQAIKDSKKKKLKRRAVDLGAEGGPLLSPPPGVNEVRPSKRRRQSRLTATQSNVRGSPSKTKLGTEDKRIKVVFSSQSNVYYRDSNAVELHQLGIVPAKRIEDCHYYCLKRGEPLKRSINLLKAVLLGKQIITDQWLSDCLSTGSVSNPQDFLARETAREESWKTTVPDAVGRGVAGVKPFGALRVVITTGLKNELGESYEEVRELILQAGARSANVLKKVEGKKLVGSLILAKKGDALIPGLTQNGHSTYSRDLVTFSILRGFVDLASDEFLLSRGLMGN